MPSFALEGFGAGVTGGAGGTTLHVTNLNDSGAGSLRAAMTNPIPRSIVFDVSGTITLSSDIVIDNEEPLSPGEIYDDMTIDGSTASNQGVQIVNGKVSVRCDNTLWKYMKLRIGDKGATTSNDCIEFDHCNGFAMTNCSVEVGDDGDCDIINSSTNGTIQWCILGPNLSSGIMLIKYSVGTPISVSVHHNVLFDSPRNPECGGPVQLDWVNNVLYRNYNPDAFSLNPPDEGIIEANYVANCYKYGSSAGYNSNKRPLYFYGSRAFSAGSSFYIANNIITNASDVIQTSTQTSIYDQPDAGTVTINGSPFAYPGITTTTAIQAYADVMANAGARLPCGLDALDTTILGLVAAGTGKASQYNDVSELGGYPDLTIPCAITTPSLAMLGKIVLSGKVVLT